MALTVKYFVQFEVGKWKSGGSITTNTTLFTEQKSQEFVLQNGAIEQPIEFQELNEAAILYLRSTQELAIKLVQPGGSLIDAQPFTLAANYPCFIPFRIGALYLSNSSGNDASVEMAIAGDGVTTAPITGPSLASLITNYNAFLQDLDTSELAKDTYFDEFGV